MATNIVTGYFVPELLAEAIRAEFAGKMALFGTGAAATSFSMKGVDRTQVGTTIRIPYFNSIGEFDVLATDGDALVPATQGSTSQTATVKHAGKAFEITQWAQWAAAGLDPYQEAARQMVQGLFRRVDKELIDTATNETAYASYINDISAGTPGTITYDAVIDARMKLGDEADAWSLMVVHSKVFGDMLKLKDSGGRPLLTDLNEGGLSKFAGIPVAVSDRIPVTASVYSNLLLKKDSLAAWVNGQPDVLTDKDILKNTNLAAVHVYYASHRYNPVAGGTKPGVVILKTK